MQTVLLFGAVLFSVISNAEPVVKVGVALRFVPELNSFSAPLYEGIQLAKDEFNSKKLTQIELLSLEHKSSHDSVEKAAERAIQLKLNYVIGGEMSDEALTLSKKFQNQSILLMSPTASYPMLTSGKPLVFSAGLSDDLVAKKYAKFVASEKNSKSIGVLHNTSNAYSDYITNAFLDEFEKVKDKKVQVQEFRYASEAPNFESAIEKFKHANVDTVIAFTLQESVKSFSAVAEKSGLKVRIIGSDGWGTNESLLAAVPNFFGVRNTYWNREGKTSAIVRFKAKYEKKYGHSPNSWAAQGYDTAMVLFHAIAKTKQATDVNSVAEVLRTHSMNEGVSAPVLKFNRKNWLQKPMYLYEIKNGKIKFLRELHS